MKKETARVVASVTLLFLFVGFVGLGARVGRRAPSTTTWVARIGDAERGERLVHAVGCGGCHVIPGVALAGGDVGPPLDAFARRVYAGSRLNTPENLIPFLVDPRSVDPASPMPRVGLSYDEARDVAAFLYTLR